MNENPKKDFGKKNKNKRCSRTKKMWSGEKKRIRRKQDEDIEIV